MENWLVLGMLAAVSYAVSGLAVKVALDRKYFGMDVTSTALLTMAGVVIAFSAFYLLYAGLKVPELKPAAAATGVAIGFFWGLGAILVYYGILRGADISRMAPIYNLNTLIIVVLAVLLLGELPDRSQLLRVGVGAVLIVLGGILVSG
jgi:uncharacterized membrane protein